MLTGAIPDTRMVAATGIESVRPFSGKRRILSPAPTVRDGCNRPDGRDERTGIALHAWSAVCRPFPEILDTTA